VANNSDIIQESDGSLSKQVRLTGGTGALGSVTVSSLPAAPSRAYSSSVSVTRPSNTNTYGAGDVVGIAVNAAITFANAAAGAGEHMITSVWFARDVTALVSGETSYTLHLYSVTPPSGLADEATWDLPSGDRASYLGFVNLGTPVDVGSTLYVEQSGINKQITAASTSIFAYLVTVGTYAATSGAVHRIGIKTVAL
jgi:hypothetical protein